MFDYLLFAQRFPDDFNFSTFANSDGRSRQYPFFYFFPTISQSFTHAIYLKELDNSHQTKPTNIFTRSVTLYLKKNVYKVLCFRYVGAQWIVSYRNVYTKQAKTL
jgi:hypothetical protein